MDWLIPSAYAQAAGASQPNALVQLLPLVLIFVVFYFLLIRPQAKRAKEHKAMVAALAVGDEVVTSGGILGKVAEAGDYARFAAAFRAGPEGAGNRRGWDDGARV